MREETESEAAKQRRVNAKGTYCGCGMCMGWTGECQGKCGELNEDGVFVYRINPQEEDNQ